jgi:23S rRNA (uracil1939-C5)-methyltransferase
MGMAEVKIEKWVYGGAGLGRVDAQVALVPYVLPGEEIQVETVRRRAQILEARATEWIVRSEHRIDAACPVFTRCGGCQYQMAPYAFQVERKVEILQEMFRRVGRFTPECAVEVISGEPWGYRNRAQFHIHGHNFGFNAPASDKVVDVDQCPILSPELNAALKKLRALRRDRNFPRFLRQVELFSNGDKTLFNVIATDGDRGVARGFFEWLETHIPGASEGQLDYPAAGFNYRVSFKSFFQVNRFLIDALVQRALDIPTPKTALDLYSGVGLFSLPLAKRGAEVTAVESDSSGSRDALENSQRAKLAVAAHRMQAEQYLEGITKSPEYVLADPPRSGLGRPVTEHLVRLKPARMTMVSCDPSTLARDMAAMLAAGYRVERVTLIDLFPQTSHIETIAQLVRS